MNHEIELSLHNQHQHPGNNENGGNNAQLEKLKPKPSHKSQIIS